MARTNFVRIYLPEAADLADLTSMRSDLDSALDFGKRLREIYETGLEFLLIDQLSTAALIRYCRTFAGGVRNKRLARDMLASLSVEQRQKHDRLDLIRDKHIAHSVNAFEESQPVARYSEGRVQEEGITSIDCNHEQIVGLGPEEASDIIELCTTLLTYADERLKQEKLRLLPIIRALPIEEVFSGGQNSRVTVDKPGKRRR